MAEDVTIHSDGAVCFVDRTAASCVRVRLEGELDAHSVPVLEAGLSRSLGPEYERIEIDLTEVSFLDSIGIRMLMSVLRRKSPGGEVRVVRPQFGGAARALDLIGFGRLVEFAPPPEAQPGRATGLSGTREPAGLPPREVRV